MDTVENFKSNIIYQKENFKDIYSSYFNNGSDTAEEEAAVSEVSENDSEIEDKILILTDNFDDILQKLFGITEIIYLKSFNIISSDITINDHLQDIDTIIIEKSYSDISIEIIGNTAKIKCMFSYRLFDKKIIITKNEGKKKLLDNVYKIYCLRELSIFEKNSFKKKSEKIINLNGLDELKEELIKLRFKYNIKFNCIKKSRENADYTNLLKGQYLCSLSLSIINSINEKKIMEKSEKQILNFISSSVLDFYTNEVNNVTKIYLIKKDFYRNFVIINCVLEEKKEFNIILNKFICSIYKEITDLKVLKSQSKIKIGLINSGLKNIDKIVTESIEKLSTSINKVV